MWRCLVPKVGFYGPMPGRYGYLHPYMARLTHISSYIEKLYGPYLTRTASIFSKNIFFNITYTIVHWFGEQKMFDGFCFDLFKQTQIYRSLFLRLKCTICRHIITLTLILAIVTLISAAYDINKCPRFRVLKENTITHARTRAHTHPRLSRDANVLTLARMRKHRHTHTHARARTDADTHTHTRTHSHMNARKYDEENVD